MIEILKNIPMNREGYKYPFIKMNVGECFYAGDYDVQLQRNMNSLGIYYSKRIKATFKTKKHFDEKQNKHVVAVFRVK